MESRAKRQNLDKSYRDRAENSLNALLDKAKPSVVASFNAPHDAQRLVLKSAYEYWLKANGQLQSMGIYPLPLSEELRTYQLTIDID